MNSIIKPDGEYLTQLFKGSLTGTRYKLVGTRSNPNEKEWRAMSAIDTFKDLSTGDYKDSIRSDIFNKAESGEIIVL